MKILNHWRTTKMLIREITYGLTAATAICFIAWDFCINHNSPSLKQAEVNKQIAIIKAEEIEAISRIVSYDLYLKSIWIEAIKDSEKQIIYVPTEDSTPNMSTKGIWDLIKGVIK
jgi:hypothetical protein